jgi:hypothetical protein
MLVLIIFALGRANYRQFSVLQERLLAATQPAISPRVLMDSIVSIDPMTLPVTDPQSGAYIGVSLSLRFKNLSGESLRFHCRLVDLGREMSNGDRQQEDWFRERWLRWSDDETSVQIPPGAHRDCEVTRQYIGSAVVAPTTQDALPRSLEPGIWVATINAEAEGFAVRRLEVRFEWRTFAPPYSQGQSLRWLASAR